MNLPGLDGVDADSGDHFGSAAALNSRRKAQDRRTAHQSNNPSFASHVDNLARQPSAQSALLADQMLLHPSSASGKLKADAPRSKQSGYTSKHSVDPYQQPQEDMGPDENVCDDDSMMDQMHGNAGAQYQHGHDNSMENTMYSNAGMMSSQPMSGSSHPNSATAASSTSFISPNIAKFKQNLLKTLQKFAKVHTQKKAAEELKQLMTTDITDNERMNMFLN